MSALQSVSVCVRSSKYHRSAGVYLGEFRQRLGRGRAETRGRRGGRQLPCRRRHDGDAAGIDGRAEAVFIVVERGACMAAIEVRVRVRHGVFRRR